MKYVLCKPRGGLNDTLCEIEKCWRYAEKTNRYLLIDTNNSGLYDDFFNYFQSDSTKVIKKNNYKELNKLDAYPKICQGELDTYQAEYSPILKNFVEKSTGARLSFNMDLTYKEDVLVHESCWEGEFLSIYCLDGLVLRPEVAQHIKQKMEDAKLDVFDYVAVHIRNTDYKMDYKKFFDQLLPDVSNKTVLVCSDDYEVFSYARKTLNKSRVVRLSTFKDNHGAPLHHTRHKDQYAMNLEVLTDLIGMAKSKKFYMANVDNTKRFSGFTMLAYTLKENPDIVRKLLSVSLQSLQPS